jgi:uncharacterized protein (TIGR00375 family)
MPVVSDLHLHSKYSRATSPKMNVVELSEAAKVKGVNLIGSGDFTHPQHLADLKATLGEPRDGIFFYNDTYFMLTAEVSNIFKWENRTRKVHNVILAPGFDVVDQINDALLNWGRLDYDGRPIFGRTCVELVDLVMSISKDVMVIPAHIWTPWFSLFGSMSGFDSVGDCFQDRTKHIHALETGMSSDPAMNWRLSALDKYTLVSFSDSHSPYPWRLGREATVFDLDEPSYNGICDAIVKKDPECLLFTIETNPEYGKYHYDGHRNCDVSMSPQEAKKHNNVCPVCRRPLTIGVEHRVEDLADRPPGSRPDDAIPFKKLIPLSELIAGIYDTTPATKTVWHEFNPLLKTFGSELEVLLNAPEKELLRITNQKVVSAIIKNRSGGIHVKPGYDGVYGVPVFEGTELAGKKANQKTLSDY